MKANCSLAAGACLVAGAAATQLLLPLYTHPGTNGAAWATIVSALSSTPDVEATVIINVDSGAGTATADWIAGAKALADLDNVQLSGYVRSDRCRRALAEVKAEVDEWSSWSDLGVNINGIFIDEAPNDGGCIDYMSSLTNHIRNEAGLDTVVFNPGFPSTPGALNGYYALKPDLISALETCFTTTTNGQDLCDGAYTVYDQGGYGTTIDTTLKDWVFTPNYARTAILIHGFHSTNGRYQATTDTLLNMLKAVVERGVGAAIFTTNHWITPNAAPADITTMVSLLDASNKSFEEDR